MSDSSPKPYSYYVVSNPVPAPEDGLTVLFAGSSQTKPGHKPGPKVVDYYLLHHVLSGKGIFSCNGSTYELSAGDSFLIEPDRLVGYTADLEDPWQYRWIAFEGERAAVMLRRIGLSSERPVVHTNRRRRVSALFHQVQQALQSRGSHAGLKANGCLLLLFAEYAETLDPHQKHMPAEASGGEQIVQQAIHYLSTQYAEPVTIELMAEALGYNRAYVSTLFKRHTGVTPIAFLARLRLDKARHLLRERLELTVEQIASSVGIQDPLYFSKQFKRMYGTTPTEYRSAFLRH